MRGAEVGVMQLKVGGRGHKPRNTSDHLEAEKDKEMDFSLRASRRNQYC